MKCYVLYGFETDKGSITYSKTIDIPFFPRPGDSFCILGNCPVKVRDSHYIADLTRADVFLDFWAVQHRNMIDTMVSFAVDKWELIDTDGDYRQSSNRSS